MLMRSLVLGHQVMARVKARDTGTLFCYSIHMYRKLGLVQSRGICHISTEPGDPEPQAGLNLCGDPRGPCSEWGSAFSTMSQQEVGW